MRVAPATASPILPSPFTRFLLLLLRSRPALPLGSIAVSSLCRGRGSRHGDSAGQERGMWVAHRGCKLRTRAKQRCVSGEPGRRAWRGASTSRRRHSCRQRSKLGVTGAMLPKLGWRGRARPLQKLYITRPNGRFNLPVQLRQEQRPPDCDHSLPDHSRAELIRRLDPHEVTAGLRIRMPDRRTRVRVSERAAVAEVPAVGDALSAELRA